MLSFYKVIQNALDMLASRDTIAYLYGGDGSICTETYWKRWIARYPNRIPEAEQEKIHDFTIGKRVYDCSQLVITCCGAPDMTSKRIIDMCNPVTEDLAAGVEGSILWKPGHVGIDIGYGYAIDIPTEGQTVRIRPISVGGWKKSGQLWTYVNYMNARAMDPNRGGSHGSN